MLIIKLVLDPVSAGPENHQINDPKQDQGIVYNDR
jgi:hypothetical protein